MNDKFDPAKSTENLTHCREVGAKAARDGIAVYDRSFSKKSHGKVLWLAACFDVLAETQRGWIETGTMSIVPDAQHGMKVTPRRWPR